MNLKTLFHSPAKIKFSALKTPCIPKVMGPHVSPSKITIHDCHYDHLMILVVV